jgi:hypothetical protein
VASGIPMPGSLYSDSRPWPTTSAFPALLVVPCVGPAGTLGARWGQAALPMSDRESRAGALTGYRRGVNPGIPAARPAVMSGRLECRPAGAPQDGRSPAAGVVNGQINGGGGSPADFMKVHRLRAPARAPGVACHHRSQQHRLDSASSVSRLTVSQPVADYHGPGQAMVAFRQQLSLGQP